MPELETTASPAPLIQSVTTTKRHGLAMLGVLAVAIVVRFIFIGYGEPGFDELWHLELSTGRGSAHETLPMNRLIVAPQLTSLSAAPAWYRIPFTLDTVTHPPLYPMVLRGWRTIMGESITAGRALSACLSVLCVAVLVAAVGQIHQRGTALWAGLILAMSSTQIELAQEVRNYTLATLLCLVAAAGLLGIERRGVSAARVGALFVGLLGGMMTHYFAAPAVGAMAIYALVRFRGNRRRWAMIAIIGAGLVFAGLWGPMLRRQEGAFAGALTPNALRELRPDHVKLTLERLASLPVRLLFEPRQQTNRVAVLGGSIFIIPFFLLKKQPGLLLWVLWLDCIAGFIAALDLAQSSRHLDQIRHTVLAGPALCAILASLAESQKREIAHGLPALVVIACLGAIGLTYTRDNPRYSDIGRQLADARYAHEPIVFYSDPPLRWWAHWMLLGASHYSGTFPRPIVRLDKPAGEELLRELHRWDQVWLVTGPTRHSAQQLLPGAQVISTGGEPYLGSVTHLRWSNVTQGWATGGAIQGTASP